MRVGRDTQGFSPSKVEQPMMEDKRSFISRLASGPKKTNPRAIDFEPSLKTSDRKVMVKEQKPPLRGTYAGGGAIDAVHRL